MVVMISAATMVTRAARPRDTDVPIRASVESPDLRSQSTVATRTWDMSQKCGDQALVREGQHPDTQARQDRAGAKTSGNGLPMKRPTSAPERARAPGTARQSVATVGAGRSLGSAGRV